MRVLVKREHTYGRVRRVKGERYEALDALIPRMLVAGFVEIEEEAPTLFDAPKELKRPKAKSASHGAR